MEGGLELCFLFDSHVLLLYRKLLLVITRHYSSILRCFAVIQSNACLEMFHIHYSAVARLILGEPGNEAIVGESI